jgi:hypothetical protein
MPVALDTILADNALVSLDEVKAHLSITRPTDPDDLVPDDQRLVDAINWVSEWVEMNIRPMARKTETLRMSLPRGPHLLRLLRIPLDVTQPVTCSLADTAQTVWTQETDGARSGFDVLVRYSVPGSRWSPDGLWRPAGWDGGGLTWGGGHWLQCSCGCSGAGAGGHGSGDPQPILLTYTGGFDCLPDPPGVNQLPRDVHYAVLETVRSWSRNQQQGTADIVSIAQPGGGPTFEIPRWMPYGAQQAFLSHRPIWVS